MPGLTNLSMKFRIQSRKFTSVLEVPVENANANANAAAKPKVSRRKLAKTQGLTPPPPPSEFPSYTSKDFFHFEILHQSKKSRARVGRIHTPHGVIDTPGFVAVGTNGALKCVTLPQADALGMQLMFCNTYHLLLHPGPAIIEKGGGLHNFIGRPKGPLITDSGGFQVFSFTHTSVADELNMKARAKKHTLGQEIKPPVITEEGAVFQSYRDGSYVKLTPESSVQAQKAYGADIIIPLDELPPYHIDRDALHRSVCLSHRWMARSLQEHLRDVRKQAMFAVVHGGVDKELRALSASYLSSLPFDGFAIGGSLGKDRNELFYLLSHLMPQLPTAKPKHLLGIADVLSIEHAVSEGVDTFDSCFPTRVARHGSLFTNANETRRIHLRAKRYENDYRTVENDIDLDFTDIGAGKASFAYLRHLLRTHEPVASTLMTLHNLRYMYTKMKTIREMIMRDEI